MSTTGRVCALIDIDSAEGTPREAVGGKAATLARLRAAGLPVPPGLVVPVHAGEDDVRSMAEDIAARYHGRRLAVRSSGIAEDLATASFAGQYESVLDVQAEPEAIAAAIRRVRASTGAGHVAAYADVATSGMATLIMPMLEPQAAGIAFTRDPVNGRDVVVLEAVPGVADRLAAGEAVGERWTVDGRPERHSDLAALSESDAVRVADLARRVEELEGSPQDIEWALADGELYLLQARPITTLADAEPPPAHEEVPPGPWEWDSTHSRIPMTPLTASLFCPAFERGSRMWVEHYGLPVDHIAMRTINGFLYTQVVPPVGKPGSSPPPPAIMRKLFRVIPGLRRREATAKRVLEERTDRRLLEEWRRVVRPRIEAVLETWSDPDLADFDEAALSARLREAAAVQGEVLNWTQLTDPTYLLPLVRLLEFLEEELGEGMETATRLLAGSIHSEYRASLSALSERMRSSPEARAALDGPPEDIAARLEAVDPALAASYRAHRRAHGLRVLGFDVDQPTLFERPEVERAVLSGAAAADAGVATASAVPHDAAKGAEACAAGLRARLDPERTARFDLLLAESRETYPVREDGEAVHFRAFGAVRLAALEIGRRMVAAGHLELPEHVAFLSFDELTAWSDAPTDARPTVEDRRLRHRSALGRTPPATVGGDAQDFDLAMFSPSVARIMRVFKVVIAHDGRPARPKEGADGVAASPGVHTGTVRVVRGPEEFGKVKTGDVVVAPITTTPWEVLFPHIGALVTEGGGLLSHAAIVAREYRLPAVVGLEGATSKFHDGQLVTVDGAAGTVSAA